MEDTYLDPNATQEVVGDEEGEDAPMSDMSEDEQDGDQDVEIDMSNNSFAYFDQHTDSVFRVGLHPKLPLAISGGGDDVAYLWTTNSSPPRMLTKLTGHTDSVVAGGFSPDGEWIVTGGMDGRVRVWRSRSRGQMWEFWSVLEEVQEVVFVTFHPTLPVFAFGANDGSMWVCSLTPRLETMSVLYGHHESCTAGVFLPAEGEEINVLSASEDGSVISWSVPAGTQNFRLAHQQFHYDAQWISVSLHSSGTSVAVGSADGKFAVIGVRTGSVIANLDLTATEPELIPEEERGIESISWCDSLGVVAVGMISGEIRLLDTGSWRTRRTLHVDEPVTKVQFVQNSPILVGSSMDGTVRKWDARTGDEIWKGTGHSSGVLDFAISADGHTIVTASDEGVSLVFKDQ
ncbi:WD40-repeat-containing domain protein [Dipodascopsis tothii]|uniref:WD40-repeat-containing domain protein n=1 Tax=Dipodascopsis tothii TaxID=44089 RepID=UPI0034CFC7FA